MGDHICTTDSFDTGERLKDHECMVCLHKVDMKITYVGLMCPNCKFSMEGTEWRGMIAKAQREYLELSRKELGDILGYTKNTIHQYEWVKCPDKYWNKLQELVKRGL